MKILVVDDDPTMRRLVARLAARHPKSQVREAEDGVAALAAIEADAPDLLFTDIQMPHLDGLGLLEALRASVAHKELPVVAISSVSEKASVLRMVALGIEDYMLKPLDPATAGARFDAILARVAAKASAAGADGARKATLLLVNREEGYGDVVRAAVGGRFEVVDHLPAAAALAWAVTEKPMVALLGEGLPMPGETGIASALRAQGTTVLLLTAGGGSDSAEGFDGVVTRSYAPKKLAEALEPHLSQSPADHTQLATVLEAEVRKDVASGCQQSLGLLVGQESTEIEAPGTLPTDAVAVEVTLSREGTAESVIVGLVASREDAMALAALPECDHEDQTALFSALATHVSARVVQALMQRGWTFAAGEPAGASAPAELEPGTTRVDVRTESGQVLLAFLRIGATTPQGTTPTEATEATEATATAAAADPEAAAEDAS